MQEPKWRNSEQHNYIPMIIGKLWHTYEQWICDDEIADILLWNVLEFQVQDNISVEHNHSPARALNKFISHVFDVS